MKYKFIPALAPSAEHFQEDSFIVNEAGWLTLGHLEAIDNALGANAADRTTLEAQIATLTTEASTLQASLETSNAALVTANATIENLNAQIVTLGKKPAASFTPIKKDGDDKQQGDNEKDQYLTSIDLEKKQMQASWGEKK